MLLPVAFMMVWTLAVFWAYLFQPLVTWSMERLFTSFSPVSMAWFVMRINAVTPITSTAENLLFRLSSALCILSKSTFADASSIFSKLFSAPSSFRLSFSAFRVLMLCRVFRSNCALSNRISTTRSSIS